MRPADGLCARARDFFTNRRTWEGSAATKLALTLRNRARALTRGCCGHPGQPGC